MPLLVSQTSEPRKALLLVPSFQAAMPSTEASASFLTYSQAAAVSGQSPERLPAPIYAASSRGLVAICEAAARFGDVVDLAR